MYFYLHILIMFVFNFFGRFSADKVQSSYAKIRMAASSFYNGYSVAVMQFSINHD